MLKKKLTKTTIKKNKIITKIRKKENLGNSKIKQIKANFIPKIRTRSIP